MPEYDPGVGCPQCAEGLDDPDSYDSSGWWWNESSTTCTYSPIVIATGAAQAYQLTNPADGVLFDIDADGQLEQVSWTKADSDVTFLALDRNGNGRIDSGRELFGNHTLPGSPNGFEALANTVDTNRDGGVDRDDPLFAELLLWPDRNHNGVSEPDELTPASDVLEVIGLGYTVTPRRDGAGNMNRLQGWARRPVVGRTGRDPRGASAWKTDRTREFRIYDVYLRKQ